VSGDEYCHRTAITRLSVSPHDESLLRETVDEWKRGCQIASDKAWECCHSKADVQQLAYDDVREETTLGSQHAILACHQVSDNIKSCISRRREGRKAGKPTYTSPTISYDSRTMTVFPEQEAVSLTTHGDHSRVRADLVLPDDGDGYQHQFLSSEAWEPTQSTLHYRSGEWYLHLGFRKHKPDADETGTTENGTVLGVDLGAENIAVTSTGTFWTADEMNHWREEYVKRRQSLQECGTRFAHENVQSVGRTETGRFEQHLHRVANGIVFEAVQNSCSYIAFERLTNIRERLPHVRKFHEWAFRRLYEYVEYKAEVSGIAVEQVNPQYTSQRCSTCGFTVEANRPSQDAFCCQDCGYENHADYNAAKNIGLKLLRNQTGGEGGAPVGVRLNSGMLNTNGVVPVPDSVRVGVHAECHGL